MNACRQDVDMTGVLVSVHDKAREVLHPNIVVHDTMAVRQI